MTTKFDKFFAVYLMLMGTGLIIASHTGHADNATMAVAVGVCFLGIGSFAAGLMAGT